MANITFWDELNEAEKAYFFRLQEITKSITGTDFLEIGAGWGISGTAFLSAREDINLISVDKDDLPLPKKRISDNGLSGRYKYIVNDSVGFLTDRANSDKKWDLIYIDGDHTFNGAHRDIKHVWPKLKEGGLMVLDDYFHYLNDEGEYGVKTNVRRFSIGNNTSFMVYPECNGFVVFKK